MSQTSTPESNTTVMVPRMWSHVAWRVASGEWRVASAEQVCTLLQVTETASYTTPLCKISIWYFIQYLLYNLIKLLQLRQTGARTKFHRLFYLLRNC